MQMRILTALSLPALLVALSGTAQATTLTFADSPGNNADLPEFYGSNVAVDSAAFVTSDGTGATPDIGLTWAPTGSTGAEALEFHAAVTFANAGFDVPVLQFDVDGSVQPGSIPPPDPTILFTVGAGAQLQLHGFDIGNATDQTEPPYGWIINLVRQSDNAVVWTHDTGLMSAGDFQQVSINFTGGVGEDFLLTFDDSGANRVRTAIDNLSFSQVPEPASLALMSIGGVLLARRRR